MLTQSLQPSTQQVSPDDQPAPWGWRDLPYVLLLAVGYVLFTRLLDRSAWPLHFDAYRDLAGMQNVLAGYWWRDPGLLGFPPWYPPLFVWLYGSLAKLLCIEPHLVASSSRFWVNVWIPIAIYALLRTSVSRPAAFMAPVILVTTSVWWMSHLSVAMPSVQGVLLVLLGFRAWHLARNEQGWRLAPGILVALAAWCHPIATIFLASTFTLDAVRALIQEQREKAWIVWRQLLTTGVLSILLASPVLYNLLLLPRNNNTPYEYFGHELLIPWYAYQSHVMPAPLLGLIGIVYILLKRPTLRWMPCYLLVGIVGQALGYVGHVYGITRLILVPHQFQWHTQIALTLAAVVLVDALWRYAVQQHHRVLVGICGFTTVGVILLGMNVPVYPTHAFCDAQKSFQRHRPLIDWIRAKTDIDDVFMSADLDAYFIIGPYTGRKYVHSHTAHMNPAAHFEQRDAAFEAFATQSDPNVLLPLVARYSIDYVLLTPEALTAGSFPALQHPEFAHEVFHDPNEECRVYAVTPPKP